MGKNVVEKILAAHLMEGKYEKGAQIGIRIDQTLTQDATGTMAYLELEAMNIDKVKTELSVSYVDHNMSQFGEENANDHLYLQTIAANKGVKFSRPGNGICHQVHLERFGIPGKTLLGSDSHTPTNGGIGMLSIGAGGLDVSIAMAGGAFKLRVPQVIGVKLTGQLRPWIAAKDVILKLLSILSTKGNVGCIIEYFGEGVGSLSVPERSTITNMGAELGVTTSIFPSDKATLAFLNAQKRGDTWQELLPDADAQYDRVIEINLSTLDALVACPSSPDNIKELKSLLGTPVQQVVIGSCTNSSFKDLMMVAKVLKGKTISANTSAMILPGSRQVLKMLSANGAMSDIISAGVRILESGCGACIGQGGSPAEGTISVRTFNRNFAGRSGTKGDQVYLVSPETAVACALTGKFTLPSDLGIDYPEWSMPEEFIIDDRMIIEKVEENIEIVRKRTIGDPPANDGYPTKISGEVVIKVGDKITTDHIMPAGVHLKLRSNIPAYSKVVFECFTEEGKASFAERSEALKAKGIHAVIVAKESYGQGSSREHAAICPMYLGVKTIIAVTIERIHAANLINFGILPLLFNDSADYNLIDQEDQVLIEDTHKQLLAKGDIKVKILKKSGKTKEVSCTHTLSDTDIDILLAGGRLNYEASN